MGKPNVIQFGDKKSIEYLNRDDPDSKYITAPAELIEEANDLINKYHKHLKTASICYMFNKKPMKSKNKLIFGKAIKCSERDKSLHGYDFIVIISQPVYDNIGPKMRRAGLDHELCHCYKDPEGTASIPHDFEDFSCIIERHGFWSHDLKALEKKFKQLKLEFESEE